LINNEWKNINKEPYCVRVGIFVVVDFLIQFWIQKIAKKRKKQQHY